jgi:[ribosomal protein S5]-alanine N-acetyltransferase
MSELGPKRRPMANIIETPRLILRPFQPDDAIVASRWFSDPIVMRHTPSGPDASLARTCERLAGYEAHQAQHGFSKWLVVERASGHPIGDAGLLVLESEGWIDLGFRFERASWGKGYATEVGAAWVSVAFGDLGIEQLGAFVHPENIASMKVLERLGFHDEATRTVLGMPAVTYTLQRLGRITRL